MNYGIIFLKLQRLLNIEWVFIDGSYIRTQVERYRMKNRAIGRRSSCGGVYLFGVRPNENTP